MRSNRTGIVMRSLLGDITPYGCKSVRPAPLHDRAHAPAHELQPKRVKKSFGACIPYPAPSLPHT